MGDETKFATPIQPLSPRHFFLYFVNVMRTAFVGGREQGREWMKRSHPTELFVHCNVLFRFEDRRENTCKLRERNKRRKGQNFQLASCFLLLLAASFSPFASQSFPPLVRRILSAPVNFASVIIYLNQQQEQKSKHAQMNKFSFLLFLSPQPNKLYNQPLNLLFPFFI